MLIDEIGLQQEAAKRRERLLIWLLLAFVVVCGIGVGVRLYRSSQSRVDRGSAQSVSFAGRTLQLPPLWKPDLAETTVHTLVLTPEGLAPGANPKRISLEDERDHPETPSQFVDGWLKTPHEPDPTVESMIPYYDASVNAVGASCVRIAYGGAERSLKIICLAHDGRYKVTFTGSERDIRPLDSLIEQFTVLEN
ncbi:hypothetical protein SAMN05421819_0919 [Bryocella elongata]|uniref:Uncharacterized protein n=1 Tax=Bryocella elongata TaxID=863522 RepID=A0A1H5UB72_9BACT|nr:hypothetical protein [Bryocella elongata]SEF71507.1 hypothetical protein SAMN05421819_0919 [Bryocella elongata]